MNNTPNPQFACFWTVGGSRSTQREPTKTKREHAHINILLCNQFPNLCRYLFRSADSRLTENGCICDLPCNYSPHVLATIEHNLFAHELLPLDDMRYVHFLSAVLSMYSQNERCYLLPSPLLFFFIFFFSFLDLWENH